MFILDNLWFLSGSDSRSMVNRVFLAAKMVTECGNSFPYDFTAISSTAEIGGRNWYTSYKCAWYIFNQDTEHKLNVVWLWKTEVLVMSPLTAVLSLYMIKVVIAVHYHGIWRNPDFRRTLKGKLFFCFCKSKSWNVSFSPYIWNWWKGRIKSVLNCWASQCSHCTRYS